MKLVLIFMYYLFNVSNACLAQQLMQTGEEARTGKEKLVQRPADLYKIEEHKILFIGKPLKVLFREIQPPIKRVMAQPSVNIHSSVGYFIFNFINNRKNDSLRSKGKIPETLVVYVKEDFNWDFQKRPKGKETIWTSPDEKKYGNLTIIGFRIYGDTSIEN